MTKPPTGVRDRKSRGRSPLKILGFLVNSTNFRMFMVSFSTDEFNLLNETTVWKKPVFHLLVSFCIIWTYHYRPGGAAAKPEKFWRFFQTKTITFSVSEYLGVAAAEPEEKFVVFEAKSCFQRFMS